MGKKKRGREQIVQCEACGRRVPRDKAVVYSKAISFTTDLRTAEDVKFFERRKVYYCISCGKHRKIFEKKKKRLMSKYNQ